MDIEEALAEYNKGLLSMEEAEAMRARWLSLLNVDSLTERRTPADYGQQSGVVRRAQAMQAMTAAERASYRRGYQAHAQSVYRWRQRVLQALRSQLHGEAPESL
jgi:hypothetical protein